MLLTRSSEGAPHGRMYAHHVMEALMRPLARNGRARYPCHVESSGDERSGAQDDGSGISLPDTLYHYTTISGFMGILDSGSLWATDARYMNDSSELKFGIQYMKEETLARAKDPWMHYLLESVFSDAMHEGRRLATASYCADGDLLSQWRAYSGHAGYSIGLDSVECARLLRRSDVASPFFPVFYDMASVRKFSRTVAGRLVAAWEATSWQQMYSAGDVGNPHSTERHEVIAEHLEEIVRVSYRATAIGRWLSAYLKDPVFAEEREWRTVVPAGGSTGRPWKFREGQTGLTPYVVLDLRNENGLIPLREIIVAPGPDQDLRVEATSMLLAQQGYSTDVVVRPSPIPYR